MIAVDCGCRHCATKPRKGPWITTREMAQWSFLRAIFEKDVANGLEGESSVDPGSRMFSALRPVGLCVDSGCVGLPRHMAGQHVR